MTHEGEIRSVSSGIYVTGYYGACVSCVWVCDEVRETRGTALKDFIDHTKEAAT